MENMTEYKKPEEGNNQAAAEQLPAYSPRYETRNREHVPFYMRRGFMRKSLFISACLSIIALMFTGLVFAVDQYSNAKRNPNSVDPNIVPATQPTMAAGVGARGADVVARQLLDPKLGMFACPNVDGLSCGWGQACSPSGCIDIIPKDHLARAAASDEPTPYVESSSTTTVTEYTAPITLPTTWFSYPTSDSSASSTADAAGTETSPPVYGTGVTGSSSGSAQGILPTDTSSGTATDTPTDTSVETPTAAPTLPNAASRMGGEACLVSAGAGLLALAVVGFLL